MDSTYTQDDSGQLPEAAVAPGTVLAWGFNGSGELGDGTTIDRASPVPVQGLTGVTALAAGNAHSLALLADGTVRAWGSTASVSSVTARPSTAPAQCRVPRSSSPLIHIRYWTAKAHPAQARTSSDQERRGVPDTSGNEASLCQIGV
jgi:alpha-tubulin suppressor-like RCC1 family protein